MQLTVAELKKALEGVPDDAEIYYQRIEDHYFTDGGWHSKSLRYERDEPSDYVPAFSAYKHPDDNVFVINAHY